MASNLSLSKLPWYGQIGAFAALALVAAAVFWTWYAQPAQAEIDTRRGELARLRADIDRGLSTARRLPEFRKEVADLELQLLTHRGHLTPAEQTRRQELKKRKRQLKDRMAWFESILREHEATP